MNDELRLSPRTLERHHRGSRDVGGGLGAEIASHEVKTQVETCGRASRCQHISVVDMHSSPPLLVMDYVGPALGAVIFVLVMSLAKEPTRRTLNAILVAGASGVYLSGGFGLWELLYPAITTPVVYLGLRSYRFIGLAWLMHSCWDFVHHFWGNPIWPFMPNAVTTRPASD